MDSLLRTLTSRRFWILLIPTWFFSGFCYRIVPIARIRKMKASATWGSFFSLPLFALLWRYLHIAWWWMLVWVILLIVSLLSIPHAEREIGPSADYKGRMRTHDQSEIVVDEVLGMFFATAPTLFIGITEPLRFVLYAGIAFFLFRFFDVVKIWPANLFDKELSAADVIMDDIVAGIYSAMVLLAILAIA